MAERVSPELIHVATHPTQQPAYTIEPPLDHGPSLSHLNNYNTGEDVQRMINSLGVKKKAYPIDKVIFLGNEQS